MSATPAELDLIQKTLQNAREELVKHAHVLALGAGFQDRNARSMAVMMMLMGAAQLYALSNAGGGSQASGMYEIFKALAAGMATSDFKAVVGRSLTDLGPELQQGMGLIKGV